MPESRIPQQRSSSGDQDESHEIELKLRFDSLDPLDSAGFRLILEKERHFEDNWLLDTPDVDLGHGGAILRLRFAGDSGSITYKAVTDSESAPSQFKRRVEIETGVDDPASALALLGKIGFHKWFRYQKFRTVYRAIVDEDKEILVLFDETPIGNFVELEGDEDVLALVVERMGIRPEDYILDSYVVLQVKHCTERRLPFQDMVFGTD